MIEIANTGERILPDKETPLMVARHLSAYKLAQKYVPGKEVLDIGCGEGYGTHYLSGYAKSITGIDYNAEAVAHAGAKYVNANTRFEAIDVKHLSALNRRFEVICCFQVIEHIDNTRDFLSAVKNLLIEDGIFICSTPNKLDASPDSAEPANKFHVREYLVDEFSRLLQSHFSKIQMFGLKRGLKLNFYRRLKKIGLPVKGFYGRIDTANFTLTATNLASALDFIAVCNK